ncbi:MAG TPA: DUF58 domain-containing protein [Bryobacteraceae bacterium]|nr:DUF58 domain-containing protein [Bryobacteraceae bacterium]
MPAVVENRYLDPKVLAEISSLDLVAKTVVDGFVAGLHRSPDFGFSQEFAEYRAYTPGDDLRHVDWNVFARTERAFLKRYRGETNTEVTVLLDTSASMGFGSGPVRKIDYAKFLAASIVYLANLQRDGTGIITFDDQVTNYVPPSGRQGQLMRLLHAIDRAALGERTNFAAPFFQLQQLVKRRGITVLISDFLEKPDTILETLAPMRARGQELILLQVLDRSEIAPKFNASVMLVDMETGDETETTPEYAASEYGVKIARHLSDLKTKSEAAGIDYFLLSTDRPLDDALREYFNIRHRRN